MTVPLTAPQLIVVCALLIAPVAAANAQSQSPQRPNSVQAAGHHELKLKPQKLRLTISIRAEGADAKSAIESFLAHKERVKKELVAMKADEATIDFGSTQVSGGIAGMPAEYQSYESRYIAQLTRTQPNLNAADIPKIYNAVARVRAEWPLPTTDPDALAILPETLKEQIKARDLTGEKNKAKLEGKQQEKLEEIQAAMQENMGYGSGDNAAPFTVMFVAKVDDESRKKALKSAFDQAVAQAELLATAAGHKKGELIALRSSDLPSSGLAEADSSAYARMYAAYAASAATNMANLVTDEALAASASEVKFATRVEVEFALVK